MCQWELELSWRKDAAHKLAGYVLACCMPVAVAQGSVGVGGQSALLPACLPSGITHASLRCLANC